MSKVKMGIYFDDIHSFHDLNLYLSAVDIPPAQPKTTYVDIPGGDGSVDLTEANGEVKFNDRDCKFTFTMNPSEQCTWEEKKTEVSNRINGKVFKITLDKDDGFYYLGRCSVNDYISNKNLNQIVITAKVKPYKFRQYQTVIKYSLSETEKTVNITNSRKSVVPVIECSYDDTIVVFGNTEYTLSAGKHKILDIQFIEGNNQLKLSGSGTIVFTFQEAEL